MMPRSPDLAIVLLTDIQTYTYRQTDRQNDCFTPCTCMWDNYVGGGRGILTVLIFFGKLLEKTLRIKFCGFKVTEPTVEVHLVVMSPLPPPPCIG